MKVPEVGRVCVAGVVVQARVDMHVAWRLYLCNVWSQLEKTK